MDEAVRIDGRTARGQRTRAAVVDALLALQEEGDLEPTAQRVAARAGVALRTVFGHFSDMETLWAQAGEREYAKMASVADVPSGDLPLDERVERFSASRARVLESVLPVLRAARLREHASAALRHNREIFAAAGDAEVLAVFAAELDPLDEHERAVVLSAFHVVAGGNAWELLRYQRGLGFDEAADVLHRTVRRLVPTSGPL